MTQQEFNERKRIMDLGGNVTWKEIDSIDWTDDDAEFEYDAILAAMPWPPYTHSNAASEYTS